MTKKNNLPDKLFNIMLDNMRTASVREVQHHLHKVLGWVAEGETVLITKYKAIVAKLLPAREEKQKIDPHFFTKRLKTTYKKKPRGKPASEILIEMRDKEQERLFS